MEISVVSFCGVITLFIIFVSVETFQLFKTEKSVAIPFPVKRRITLVSCFSLQHHQCILCTLDQILKMLMRFEYITENLNLL